MDHADSYVCYSRNSCIHDAEFTSENREMSADVIKNAFLATEEEFLSLVRKQWDIRPKMASVGSCCLVGIICGGRLYIANSGDSRAVLGRLSKAEREVKAIQLSTEHNANLESVRDELHSLHPDDPGIVVLKHNVWRVKGIIQVNSLILTTTLVKILKRKFWFVECTGKIVVILLVRCNLDHSQWMIG